MSTPQAEIGTVVGEGRGVQRRKMTFEEFADFWLNVEWL